jgi:hypothetical protein
MPALNYGHQEPTMVSSDAYVTTVRLDVLRDIMVELAGALPADSAARIVAAIGHRLTQRLCDIAIDEPTDDAMVSDLAPILAALAALVWGRPRRHRFRWATTLKRHLATVLNQALPAR